ncbi:MAG TPA: hypothetical protein VIU41_12450 [Geobacteraceae bacterium]
MIRKMPLLLTLLLILSAGAAMAAGLFAGYGKLAWGSGFHDVNKAYPKGEMSKLGTQDIYKQKAPAKEYKQRSFAFRDGKLYAVSLTFNPAYVKKAGIESLLAKQRKQFGEGVMDRSNAPHMMSYRWEDARTRITFAYAPKKPEMTILMYEQK